LTIFGLFVVILGIDGFNSYFHLFPNFRGLYTPTNSLRLITGVFGGLTMINLLLPIFNASVWREGDQRPPIANLKELAGVCLAATLVILATLTHRAGILLAFGLISALGVLIVLTLINSVMVIAFMQRDHSYTHWRELWLPLLIGATIAVTLVGSIDFVRFTFTGSWDGFEFQTATLFLLGR
jgi:hypothetical protein